MGANRVSIIVPCHNAEPHLAETIESVLAQDCDGVELVIVDDGSTDRSADVAASYPAVRVIRSDNQGAAAARNLGLKSATGELIKFLDADDTLCTGALVSQLEQIAGLRRHESPYGDYYFQRGSGLRLRKVPKIPERNHAAQVALTDLMTSTPLHRREWLELVGGFDERFDSSQEWNLHVRLASAGVRFRYFSDPIYVYRMHDDPERVSKAKSRRAGFINGELQKIEWTLEAVHPDTELEAALARRAVWLARVATKRGETKAALRCFAFARQTSSRYTRYWPAHYRALHRLLGASKAERALIRYWGRR